MLFGSRITLIGTISKVTIKVIQDQAKNIDHLLMRKGAVDHAIVRSLERINGTCISLKEF